MLGIQGPSGSDGPPPPNPGYETNAPNWPIDDNIWILVTVGVVFGIYMIYKKQNATNKAS